MGDRYYGADAGDSLAGLALMLLPMLIIGMAKAIAAVCRGIFYMNRSAYRCIKGRISARKALKAEQNV